MPTEHIWRTIPAHYLVSMLRERNIALPLELLMKCKIKPPARARALELIQILRERDIPIPPELLEHTGKFAAQPHHFITSAQG